MLASDDIVLTGSRAITAAAARPSATTMLPPFNGADSVFRGILVPVFGLEAS